jgi:catechol 2,3-dioxygenase-like lactoylglutathione lyase family enzyme
MSDPPSHRPSAHRPLVQRLRPPIRADNLQFLRKQAKMLLRDYERGDPLARSRLAAIFPSHHGVPSRIDIGLAEAQLVLARELGYPSWPKLMQHLANPSEQNSAENSEKNSTKTSTREKSMTTSATQNLGFNSIDQIGLSCTDLDEAQRFYCDILGLRFAGEALPQMKFFDCGGVNIIMFKGETVTPGSVIYFRVEGIPGLIQSKFDLMKSLGVNVQAEPRCIANNWHGHDVWLGFFKDPFGNLLAMKSDVPVK